MKRLSIGLAALAALVSFSGVAVVARAEGPVRCDVMKDGKMHTKHVKTADDCTKMHGKVISNPKAEPKAESKPESKPK